MVPFRWFSACATIVFAVCLIISCDNPTSSDDPVTPDDPSGGDPTTYTNTITVNGEDYGIELVTITDTGDSRVIDLSQTAPATSIIGADVLLEPPTPNHVCVEVSYTGPNEIPVGRYTVISVDQCIAIDISCGDCEATWNESNPATIDFAVSGTDGDTIMVSGSIDYADGDITGSVTVSYSGPYTPVDS